MNVQSKNACGCMAEINMSKCNPTEKLLQFIKHLNPNIRKNL